MSLISQLESIWRRMKGVSEEDVLVALGVLHETTGTGTTATGITWTRRWV